jgi:hypothetical protein
MLDFYLTMTQVKRGFPTARKQLEKSKRKNIFIEAEGYLISIICHYSGTRNNETFSETCLELTALNFYSQTLKQSVIAKCVEPET